MKKIAMILPSLGGGGAERVTLSLARKLTETGNEVHIILLADRISYDIEEEISVHALSGTGRITGQRLLDRVLLGRRLRKLINRLGAATPFDLILSNLLDADHIVSRQKLESVFYVIHNTTSREIATRDSDTKRRRRTRKILDTYDGKDIVCVSEGVRRDLLDVVGVTPRSCRTIYNPFDVAAIRKKAREVPAGLPSEDYLVHAGRIHPQKRIDVLLEAFSQVRTDCKLVMLAEPTEELYRMIVDEGLTGRVILPGFQTNPYPWIANARLFVLSSDYEGFGNVLVESLICGTPVVSVDCPSGPNEILTGSLARWLVPPGDPAALAGKIDEALASEIDVSGFDANRFEIGNVARQYLALCSRPPRENGRAA